MNILESNSDAKKPAILSVGEVLWDLFPSGEQFGGAPANFACHAAIGGADVTMVSAVGEDGRGRQAVESLCKYNIDCTQIQTVPNAETGTVGVELDQQGKPTFEIHEPSAWDSISWSSELASKIPLVDAVYFGTLGQRNEESRDTIRKIVRTATESSIHRVLDVNLRAPFYDDRMICDSVELASILKLSDDELAEVCHACGIQDASPTVMLGRIRQSFDLDLVIMTKGSDGAVLLSAEEMIEQPGIPADVVDTVGAGDSFIASFLLGELAAKPRRQSLLDACRAAAATCGHSGAVPGTSGPSSPS